jgi:hypothetical protein
MSARSFVQDSGARSWARAESAAIPDARTRFGMLWRQRLGSIVH